jgi:hypothetical protein
MLFNLSQPVPPDVTIDIIDGAVRFTVPVSSIPISQLLARLGQPLLQDLFIRCSSTIEWNKKWELLLESDEMLNEVERQLKEGPLTRANVYGNSLEFRQELLPNSRDPRRPVLMRGSIKLCIERYSQSAPYIPNVWVSKVINRFLRIKRYTCYDKKKHNDYIGNILKKLRRDFNLSHQFEKTYIWPIDVFEKRIEPNGHDYSVWYWLDGYHVRDYFGRQKRYRSINDEVKVLPVPVSLAVPVSLPEPKFLPSLPINSKPNRILVRALSDLGLLKPGDLP